MTSHPQTQSVLTDRYQTTIPSWVRTSLGLKKRDKLCYALLENGQILLSKCAIESSEEDPVLGAFLDCLERDLARPGQIKAIPEDLIARGLALTAGISVDLNRPLSDENE